MRHGWLVVVVAIGCGPAVTVDADGTTDGGAADAATSGPSTDASTTTPPMTGPATTTSTTTTVGEVTTSVDDTNTGVDFVVNPDGGSCFTHCSECDVWAQDCPEGAKCAPWANDGGDQWNATYCRELHADLAQPGEPCTISGAPASGDDDCATSSLCWDVDPETGEGTCVPFCANSEANPECADGTSCWIANEGVLILCLPTCDPIASECGDGLSCVADNDGFFCLPSERVAQLYDEPCELWLGCGTDLVCAGPGSTSACDTSCCTALCDLAAPTCPEPEQTCVPYYEPGRAPAGLDDVGVCLLDIG